MREIYLLESSSVDGYLLEDGTGDLLLESSTTDGINLISNISATGTDSTVTSGAIDTTGADLIVIGIAVDGSATPTISDSKSNTWTPLTASTLTVKTILYYCSNPTVGSGHTFSNTGAFNFCSLCVSAFSGVKTSNPFDQENGATATGVTTVQTGSVTPTEDNELIVTHLGFNAAGLPTSIDSSFIETNDAEFGAANNYGSTMAYIVQTTAGSVNPTWTRTGTGAQATRIATFKAQPTTSAAPILMLMGVG